MDNSDVTGKTGEVLVAIMNRRLDFVIAYDQHWYRIPVSSQRKWLKDRWPPQWLAFYMTKEFGEEAHGVHYFARVLTIRQAFRWQLFPDQPRNHPQANRRYHQLMLEPLRRLPEPILSRRWRRIVFIPTTWRKFVEASEINDLYDESPLEDRLWAELKRREIAAERQEFVKLGGQQYALDFAIYCAKGRLNVETDGDTWHINRERAPLDNVRDNDLETAGWHLLRFTTLQIREEMETYCIPKIIKNINRLGGLEEGGVIPRKIDPDTSTEARQPGLFDNQ